MRRPILLALTALLLLPVAAPAKAPRAATKVPKGAIAVVRTTAHGIPHVKARTLRGAGVGIGYAQARDNICVLADSYVTVSARRSQYFGPEGTYESGGNAAEFNNLKSDFSYQRIIDSGVIEKMVAEPPPSGPLPEVLKLADGFVAGYNRYLKDVGGPAGIKDPACRGAAWVRPIAPTDIYRRVYAATGLASFQFFTEALVDAQPPSLADPVPPPPLSQVDGAALRAALPGPQRLKIGSNAIALGREAVAGGKTGMMLANPHFPWNGSERFWEYQLTVPGRIDVTGASLTGFPIVNIGHTRGVAWSHTVSTAYRFTPFELTLVPGDPTSYLVDGQPKKMETQVVKVPVADGGEREHTFYSTQWGPMVTYPGALLYWTPALGYALGDANATNFRAANTFYAMGQAQSVAELRAAQERYQGIPWVNTIAADRDGNAYYADQSVVPNVPDSHVSECATSPVARAVFELAGLPILDGSRSACAWKRDEDAADPGIIGPAKLPRLERADYVSNHNDSAWLSNPEAPITGYARIVGDQATARSLRTRLGLTMIRERLAGTDGLGAPGFTLGKLRRISFGNRMYAGELMRADVLALCRSEDVDQAACDAIERWDLHADLDSRGALLFQEFLNRALGATGGHWSDSFDAARPVDTPAKLNTGNPFVAQALRDAIAHLAAKGIPFDAPMRDVQYVERNGKRIPIHGCQGPYVSIEIGCFNLMLSEPRDDGTLEPRHASSYVQATTWRGRKRRPVSHSILTYSQSTDPSSRFHGDQTELFSRKRWVRDRFTDREIARDPKLRVEVLRRR